MWGRKAMIKWRVLGHALFFLPHCLGKPVPIVLLLKRQRLQASESEELPWEGISALLQPSLFHGGQIVRVLCISANTELQIILSEATARLMGQAQVMALALSPSPKTHHQLRWLICLSKHELSGICTSFLGGQLL